MAHHAEELRAQPVQLIEWGQVLQGDHHRFDLAVLGADRCRVNQRPDATPVGDRKHDLFGTHRLGPAQDVCEREAVERKLAPVVEPAGHDLKQVLGRPARGAQALHDAPRLAVDRDRATGLPIEDHDADRRGLDQGLEVGPRKLLGTVGAAWAIAAAACTANSSRISSSASVNSCPPSLSTR